MTSQGFFVLAILIITIAALAKEVMRPGLILFSALIFLMTFGILKSDEVLAGFSNKGMITVAILFVVSEGITQSGALNRLATAFLPQAQGKYPIPVFQSDVSHFVHVSISKQYSNRDYFCPYCKKMG